MNLKIRLATAYDALELVHLAMLDSQDWGGGDAVVAEVDGKLWAALPLDGRPAVADPFRHTADLVALLGVRREQLAQASAPRRRAVRRLLRSPARA